MGHTCWTTRPERGAAGAAGDDAGETSLEKPAMTAQFDACWLSPHPSSWNGKGCARPGTVPSIEMAHWSAEGLTRLPYQPGIFTGAFQTPGLLSPSVAPLRSPSTS